MKDGDVMLDGVDDYVPMDKNSRILAVLLDDVDRSQEVKRLLRSLEWWTFLTFREEGLWAPAVTAAFLAGLSPVPGEAVLAGPFSWRCLILDLPGAVELVGGEIPPEVTRVDVAPGVKVDFGRRGEAEWREDELLIGFVRKESLPRLLMLTALRGFSYVPGTADDASEQDVIPLSRGYWMSLHNALTTVVDAAE